MSDDVSLEIGGTIFKTKKSTLNRIKGTNLAKLDSNIDIHRFDRDPCLFRHILNAYRNGTVHVPRDVCPVVFKEELLFWNIPLTLVKPCCWKYFYETDGDIETIKLLIENENRFDTSYVDDKARKDIKRTVFALEESAKDDVPKSGKFDDEREDKGSRENDLWLFLDEPGSSLIAKVWCFFYIAVVITSVIVYLIWLDPAVRVPRYLFRGKTEIDIFANDTVYQYVTASFPMKVVLMIFTDPHPLLFAVDMFCVVVFIVETVLHFSACKNKLRYIRSIYHILKIVLCVAMVISTAFEIRKDLLYNNNGLGYLHFICKSLNVLRLVLIFRLHRIYNRLHIMILSLRNSCKELALLLFCFMIAVVVYGCLIFSAEIESTMFASTYISMWWSLVTMTTIGYGDFYPTTLTGYIVGVICAISGIIVLALPIAAIAGSFSNLFARNSDFYKHKMEVRKQSLSEGNG